MVSKRNTLTKLVVITFVFAIFLFVDSKMVKADTSAKTKQGVELKTSELKVNKVIVSPKKVEEPIINETSRSVNTRMMNFNAPNRGENNKLSQVMNYAYKFLGTPYVYGGNGPDSFDCSGFTRFVCRHFGVDIPRVSSSQFGAGYAVEKNNLIPGDLVFFNTVEYLGHVGLYIGNDDFIHASSGGVKISSLSDKYYRERYEGARRVFNF